MELTSVHKINNKSVEHVHVDEILLQPQIQNKENTILYNTISYYNRTKFEKWKDYEFKKILVTFPVLILAACSNTSDIRFDSEQLDEVTQTNVSSTIINKELEYKYPVKIAKYDSLFLIQDIMNKGYVYILNSKGETIDCLAKKGNGHTEINGSPSRFNK